MGLAGKRILVTRRPEQAGAMIDEITRRGATALLAPTIQVGPPERWDECDAALARLETYRCVVFPSANAATFFLGRAEEMGIDAGRFARARIVAVGPSTAAALANRGLRVDPLPDSYDAAGVVRLLGPLPGHRVLVPRGSMGREELLEGLNRAGAVVDAVEVYRTTSVDDAEAKHRLARMLESGVDLIMFASPSAVRGFVGLAAPTPLAHIHRSSAIAAIGHTTRAAVEAAGATVDIIPADATVRSMLDEADRYFEKGT